MRIGHHMEDNNVGRLAKLRNVDRVIGKGMEQLAKQQFEIDIVQPGNR